MITTAMLCAFITFLFGGYLDSANDPTSGFGTQR